MFQYFSYFVTNSECKNVCTFIKKLSNLKTEIIETKYFVEPCIYGLVEGGVKCYGEFENEGEDKDEGEDEGVEVNEIAPSQPWQTFSTPSKTNQVVLDHMALINCVLLTRVDLVT